MKLYNYQTFSESIQSDIQENRLEEAYYGTGMAMPENIKIKGYEIV